MNKLAYGILASILTVAISTGAQFLLAYVVGYITRSGLGGFNPASVYIYLLLNIPVLLLSVFASYRLSLFYVRKVKGTILAVNNPLPLYLVSLIVGTVVVILIAELVFDAIKA